MQKIQVVIGWKKNDSEVESQTKSFGTIEDAVQFCRIHWEKIDHINYMGTYGERLSHWEIMDRLLKGEK